MRTYEKIIQVCKDDLDELNHVNNVRYVQWIQDISKEHWQFKAPSTMKKEIVWVVLKHIINYKSAAVLNDIIKISTYISKSEGATSLRIVEMYNTTTNKVLVHSQTNWCLLNATSLKPIRIPEEIKFFFTKK